MRIALRVRGSRQAGSDTPRASQAAFAELCNSEYALLPMLTVLAAVLLAAAGILVVVKTKRRRSLHRYDVGPLSQGWLTASRSEDANQH